MSIKKQALKSKPVCKINFKVSKAQAAGASAISVVGEFNNWNPVAGEMNQLKDGSFTFATELNTGRDYQFRYVADGHHWFNDEEADGLISSGIGAGMNGILSV
ncbi:MAG: isoamylase early set domain-containing protein [Bacteroidales bacterium]|nr:isoamylase early set domain-containing protein [Bacteroidales bacterium]